MITLQAGTALEVARGIAEKLPGSLSQSAILLYQVLLAVALEKAQKESYSPGVTHITFHSSLEGLAKTCGISRMTAYRQLAKLKELGVVDYRPQVKTLWGASRHTGCVFQVRLNPVEGSRCKLSYQDLKHDYRGNFAAQVKAGRTSYKMLRQMLHTKKLQINLVNFQMLLSYSLKVFTDITPVADVCNKSNRLGLEAVLDVFSAPAPKINSAVDEAATALAQALRDAASINYYRKILWQAVRRSKASGDDLGFQIYQTAVRARVDVQEGFARRGGAIFTKRLKEFAWYQEMMVLEGRVGTRPI